MKSIIPYMGGKSRLADRIIKDIPGDHTCYCEPFCGACWVLFAKEPSKAEVINDIDSELVTFWRVIQNHRGEFKRYYEYAVTSREIFEIEKRKDPTTLTDIQRAARYFYLQKLAFGGRQAGRTFGTSASGPSRLNLLSLEDALLETHWRLRTVNIEHLPALECIRRYDRTHTFFFCDPPYYETAGDGIPFTDDDYLALRDTLSAVKGRFLLTLNDHPRVREIFAPFKKKRVTLKYSVGKDQSSRSKERGELFIKNY